MLNIVVIALLAGFAIYWENRKPFYWHYLLKPMTTISLIVLAITYAAPDFNMYPALIIFGVIFSLGGDVFLMLPNDRFIPGLVSFLVAQIIYSVAFLSQASNCSIYLLLPLLIYGIWIFLKLKPSLDKLVLPVLIYLVFIMLMAWSAVNLWLDMKTLSSAFAAIGALVFVLSDSVLAWSRFRIKYRFSRSVVLGSYYLAQFLIVSSLAN